MIDPLFAEVHARQAEFRREAARQQRAARRQTTGLRAPATGWTGRLRRRGAPALAATSTPSA